jgi:hypothetical protein
MTWVIGIGSVALLAGVLVTWMAARGQRWRWGWTAAPGPVLGDGAYRSAPVTVQNPRRFPAVCAVAAIASVAWGVLTTFVFAPAGLLGCMVALHAMEEEPWTFALGTAVLAAATFDGFAIGPRLMALAKVLAVRTASSAERTLRTVRHSLAHHALVSVALGLWIADDGHDPISYIVAAAPFLVGLGHAGLLWTARARVVRFDREDRARC